MKVKSTHSTPRSDPSTRLRTGARGMPFDKLKAPSTVEGLRVDTERRFSPRLMNRGLPSTRAFRQAQGPEFNRRARAEGALSTVSRGERGASAVEFAIILPVLLILIFGIIEFGFAIYDKTMITQASREGARAGVVFRVPAITDEEIVNVVNNYLSDNLITFGGSNSATVTVTRAGYSAGSELKVRVAYTYTSLILPDLVETLSREFNLVAETTMRME